MHIEAGGQYILRAEGIDRFNNPVTAQHDVQISDDHDSVRLRILADRHTFQVGDTAEMQIHWREEPALALVTLQGARVLHYQLMQLNKGANKLALPLAARLAPNFDLCVSVMTDPRDKGREASRTSSPLPAAGEGPGVRGSPLPVRFHEATSPFTVERPLQVVLQTKRKQDAKGPIRPGEEIDVTIRASDPQGKPVQAELSLGMVEQALLGMFAGNTTPIDDIFRGSPRQSALRSSSSVEFAYNAVTRPIDRQLLAESERLDLAAEEVSRRATLELAGSEPGLGGVMYGAFGPAPILSGANNSSGSDNISSAWRTRAQSDVKEKEDIIVERLSQFGGEGFGGRGQGHRKTMSGRFGGTKQGRGDGKSPQLNTGLSEMPSDDLALDRFSFTVEGTTIGDSATLVFGGWERVVAGFAKPDPGQTAHSNKALLIGGKQYNVDYTRELGDKANEAKIAALAKKLTDAGAVLLPQNGPQETGYWNPAIVTDEKGEAQLTITLPDQSTAWKLAARGITVDTLSGEAQAELTTEKQLFGELKLPTAFTDGDEANVTVTVHNDLVERGPIDVTLKTTIGSKSVEEHRTLHPKGRGIVEVSFPASIRRPVPEKSDGAGGAGPLTPGPSPAAGRGEKEGDPAADGEATFELTVAAGADSDSIRRVIPVHPFGMPVYATAGGSASADTTVWVEQSRSMPVSAPSLQILIGPTVERSLLDVLFAPASACQMHYWRVASDLDMTTSDLLAALALQKLLGSTRESSGPHAAALDARIRSALSLLVSSQQDDGGWSWTGRGTASHRLTSARAMWGMALAKRAGYKVPDDRFEKAITYLQSQIATTGQTDYESKAILLHALAVAGHGDFTLANRLYRNRPSLSTAALAHLALALAETDHKPMANDLLSLLAERKLTDSTADRGEGSGSYAWNQSGVEIRALYALALEQVAPESPKIKELIDWLMAHRAGNRWAPDKATGPAAAAAAAWFAKNRFDQQHYQLTLFVNDKQVKTLDIDPAALTQTVDVPAGLLKSGKQRINFQLTGRGRYTFQAILSGFVPADRLKSGTHDWYVRRHYEPAPIEMDGREIPRGFDILQGNYETFTSPLTELPVGKRGHVGLEIWRRMPSNTQEEQLEYLVVTEPLPCGTTVIENSIAGGFERYEIGPGQITFYIGSKQYIGTIGFDVHGYLSGKYRAAPTVVRNAYRPDQMAVAETPSGSPDPKSLTVLPLGTKVPDPRPTPNELYVLGERLFEKGEFARAGARLTDLLEHWNLKPDNYKEAARMLLDIHLKSADPAAAKEIVHYFEIIKEKWPDLELPFEKIVRVAAAYDQIGEYERSYLVFRATTESSFARDSAVAGFLDERGEFLRSVAVMNRLLAEYPPEPYVAAATFASRSMFTTRRPPRPPIRCSASGRSTGSI